MKVACRINRCGCLMEWVRVGLVRVTPCGDDTCDAMALPAPGRGRRVMYLAIPESER